MTSLRRSKKKQNPDPLNLSVSKRPSDDLGDSVPNDILEAAVIFLALIAMTGAGVALYHLAGKV